MVHLTSKGSGQLNPYRPLWNSIVGELGMGGIWGKCMFFFSWWGWNRCFPPSLVWCGIFFSWTLMRCVLFGVSRFSPCGARVLSMWVQFLATLSLIEGDCGLLGGILIRIIPTSSMPMWSLEKCLDTTFFLETVVYVSKVSDNSVLESQQCLSIVFRIVGLCFVYEFTLSAPCMFAIQVSSLFPSVFPGLIDCGILVLPV